jgi:hypothetical protein
MSATVSRYLPPSQEFLPSTGCHRTGRVATFHQLPKSEWSCPNGYPTLPQSPEYFNYQWWKYGLGTNEFSAALQERRAQNQMLIGSGPGGWGVAEALSATAFGLGVAAALGGLIYYLVKR